MVGQTKNERGCCQISWEDMTVSVILPTLNEEHGLRFLLPQIPRHYNVTVLDGNSTDGTIHVAKEHDVKIFKQSGNGKGEALRELVTHIKDQFAIIMDSDGTYPIKALPEFYLKLLQDNPVVLGVRNFESMTSLHAIGNKLISKFASVIYKYPISDLCSGMWGFNTNTLKTFNITATGFELEADFYTECALRKVPIIEVPIDYYQRIGESKLTFIDVLKICYMLLMKQLRI